MTAFNLPPGVSLDDIDRLFEESDEEQCLDTAIEDKLTDVEPLSAEEIAALNALLDEAPIF